MQVIVIHLVIILCIFCYIFINSKFISICDGYVISLNTNGKIMHSIPQNLSINNTVFHGSCNIQHVELKEPQIQCVSRPISSSHLVSLSPEPPLSATINGHTYLQHAATSQTPQT